ncbi:hypothetical protein PINS_up022271 [Pythium insidiosum]|nr:hypothetical protein PINS_up022271 [Pythium insidiosum]
MAARRLEILVPNDRVGLIIGRARERPIKAIQFRTGTSINIPQTADSNNPNMASCDCQWHPRSPKDLAKNRRSCRSSTKTQTTRHVQLETRIYMQCRNDRVGVVIGSVARAVKGMPGPLWRPHSDPYCADAGSNPSVRTISIWVLKTLAFAAKEEIDMVILNGAGTQGAGSGALAAVMEATTG